MKRRMGFVSNSSSSSFIVGIKGDDFKDGLMYDSVLNSLGVDKESPLYPLACSIAQFIISSSNELSEDDLEDYCSASELHKDGYKVYGFYASYNETDDPIELMFGNGDFKIDTPNFKIIGGI